jgi:hypothetical protein
MRALFWRLLGKSLDRAGRLITLFMGVAGLVAGALSSNAVHVSDQYWANIGILAAVGTVVALAVDFFFVSPIQLLEECERERAESLAPPMIQGGSGPMSVRMQVTLGENASRALVDSMRAVGPLVITRYEPIRINAETSRLSNEAVRARRARRVPKAPRE